MVHELSGIGHLLLTIVTWVIIGQVILSWLFAFNVLNTGSQGLRTFVDALDRITAPFYRPIRKLMPDFGGIDFSPLVLLVLIQILRMLLGGVERSLIYSGV